MVGIGTERGLPPTKERLAPILAHFALTDEVVSCEKFGHGHINKTYLVVTEPGERFILQQVNNMVADMEAKWQQMNDVVKESCK